jgi:flagellar biosynthesis anti-sigma factor FlgM
MRIDSNQPVANQVSTERSGRGAAKSEGSGTGAHEPGSVTAETNSLSGLEAQVLATPEIRQDRVEALRQAISNGAYQVDASQIADAILRQA